MPVLVGKMAQTVADNAERRLRRIDSLLPPPAVGPPGCGAGFVALGDDGAPVAIGTCEHWEAEPGSLDRSWGAARRFRLTVTIAGPDPGSALDQLLPQWREHLAGVPGTDADDTAAIVTWPSRDVAGVAALQRHRLAPLAVIAARVTGRHQPRREAGGTGVRIRRAGPDDLGAVAALGLELVRYDAYFGSVTERPESAAALRHEAAALLAGPEPWVWLAERDGAPVGMLAAERPEAAAWIAPMARLSPIAYLCMGFVLPGERGGRIGAALTQRLHQNLEAAGVPLSLLHYSQVNPLAAPFWSEQGYRPLWTSWEAWPASALG